MKLKQDYLKDRAGTVKRFCQVLELNPETLDLYKYWHNSRNIWTEIPAGIRRAGILDMEIYIYGNHAMMILETPVDFVWNETFGKLAKYERQAE